jgi:general stress protein YciG
LKSEERPLTCREAGRRGGTKTKERHGPEHYRRIGEIGGQKIKRLIEQARALEGEEEDA